MTTLSYRFDHTPSTNSSSAVYAPTLGAMLLTGIILASIPNESAGPQKNDHCATQLNGTFSQLQNPFTGEYALQGDFDFERSMTTFYATLLSQQEALGTEFEKILYDNLWELYDD